MKDYDSSTAPNGEYLVELRLHSKNFRMHQARLAKGLTQAGLAGIIGVSGQTISQIENLWIVPSSNLGERICIALARSYDYLFPQALIEGIREGVFHKNTKRYIDEVQVISLTEAAHSKLLPECTGEEMEQELDLVLLRDKLDQVLSSMCLAPHEIAILKAHFGYDDEPSKTLEEVGRMFKLSRERIRQIEARALRRLRHPRFSRHLAAWLD